MGFVLILSHVLNVCLRETVCLSEPDGGMAKHVVMVVACVVDLSSLGDNVGPVEPDCISEQVGDMADHTVVVEVINELASHSDGCSDVSAGLWNLRISAAVFC